MAFFNSHVQYDFTVTSDPSPVISVVTDVTQRTKLSLTDEEIVIICDDYIVQDGMTPEKVAFKLYGDPHLHWTLFVINKINNISSEWPMHPVALSAYITKKYGEGHEYDTHHYEKLPEGVQMDYQFMIDTYSRPGEEPYKPLLITNTEYELAVNEDKRLIKTIKPLHIAAFVAKWA